MERRNEASDLKAATLRPDNASYIRGKLATAQRELRATVEPSKLGHSLGFLQHDGTFGVGMLEMGVPIVGSLLHQVSQPTFPQAILVSHGKIAPHLINRDLENEFRPRNGGLPQRGR